MNPIKEPLGRISFLIWSLVSSGLALALVEETKKMGGQQAGMGWQIFTLIAGVVLIALYGLIVWRRLQSAGLSRWFVLLIFVPFVATAMWIALVIIPPEKKAAEPPEQKTGV